MLIKHSISLIIYTCAIIQMWIFIAKGWKVKRVASRIRINNYTYIEIQNLNYMWYKLYNIFNLAHGNIIVFFFTIE